MLACRNQTPDRLLLRSSWSAQRTLLLDNGAAVLTVLWGCVKKNKMERRGDSYHTVHPLQSVNGHTMLISTLTGLILNPVLRTYRQQHTKRIQQYE